MAEEQAMVDVGHHGGGVQEIEGVPLQIMATPGMPERQAVGRRQARVREMMHTLPPAAKEPIRDDREGTTSTPRTRFPTIPRPHGTARPTRTTQRRRPSPHSVRGMRRDRAIAACRRRRKPAAHPHGSRFRDSTSAGHRCRGGVRPVRCGTHSHGRARWEWAQTVGGATLDTRTAAVNLRGHNLRARAEGSRSIGAGGSDRQGELRPTSGSRLVLCTSGSATMTT